jgi:HK97 family phage prohead protease
MKIHPEYRHYAIELRVAGDDKAPVLEGHAAVFNVLSEDFGDFRERIAPGAFAEAIKGDVRALWNHENDLVLGRVKSGTLSLVEDETGLAFRVTPPDTTWFRDRLVTLKRGDVTGASFGFFVDWDDPSAQQWSKEGGQKIRTILKVKELLEISPGVTFPAYPQASTEAVLRSMKAWEDEEAKKNGAGQAGVDLVDMELRNRRLQLQRQVL